MSKHRPDEYSVKLNVTVEGLTTLLHDLEAVNALYLSIFPVKVYSGGRNGSMVRVEITPAHQASLSRADIMARYGTKSG